MKQRHLPQLTALAALTLVCGLLFLAPGAAQAFCENRDDGSQCHPELAEEALDFLSPYVLEKLRETINEPDHGLSAAVSDNHFDNCNFDGGVDRINDRYLAPYAEGRIGIVHALSPYTFVANDTFKYYPLIFTAIEGWAWGLHSAQDIYAHSNWIEMGFTDWRDRDNLIDSRLQAWVELPSDWGVVRDDILASQDDLPSGWAITRPADSFVPIVTKPNGQRFRLLISGVTDHTPPANDCPDHDPARIHHNTLNKDNITRPNYIPARDMAIAQTRHEWCRLVHMVDDEYGFAGVSVMMGLLPRPDASPHPAWTPCAELPAGPIQVNVRLSKLKIVDNGDDNDSEGELNYVLALYTSDFHRSVRSQTPSTIFATSGTLVPAAQLPPPVTLCIAPGHHLIATLQGWDDDDDRDTPKLGLIDSDDDARTGITYDAGTGASLGNGQGIGEFERDSDNPGNKDIEARFVIDATPTDADGDGLSYCQEVAAGLDPNRANSDADSLSDDREVRLDTAFGDLSGRVLADLAGGHDRAYAVAALPDGRVIVAGDAETTGALGRQIAVARYNRNGRPDGFGIWGYVLEGQAGDDWGRAVAVAPSGKIVVGGFRQGQDADFGVWRFNANGTLDATFAIGFGFNVVDFGQGDDYGQAVMVGSDEKIILAGFVAAPSGGDPNRRAVGLARFGANGALDRSFGVDGKVLTPVGSGYVSVRAALLQPDGKILVVGGHAGDFLALRYTANGVLDPTFAGDGIARFGLGGNDEARAVALLPNNSIVVAGSAAGDLGAVIANSIGDDACLDCGQFTIDFGGNEGAFAVAVQPNGAFILAGASNGSDPTVSRFYLTRIRRAQFEFGYDLDAAFGAGGKLITPIANRDIARGLVFDPDLHLLAAGYSHNGQDDDFAVARYLTNLNPSPPVFHKLYLPLVSQQRS